MLANKKETSLYLHEWLVVTLFIASLLALSAYSYWKAHVGEETHTPNDAVPSYVITIQGAVQQPGQYHVKKGTTIGEAIRLAEPSSNADFKKIAMDDLIKPRTTIRVPELKKKN